MIHFYKLVASPVGMWLFYVQHQFGGVYGVRHDNRDEAQRKLVSFRALETLLLAT
ncbi:hypothetical protein [uncultured Desulfosarcina sp.]|uniref:hypothetical protein n=1 Tax=uncultured Desulfosarcina sp. TaxID=218289 RepID=UPI0029C7A5DB|nr:hypothetical protein [uncultured Desulfosarcina sp.]